jgi:hypothetical protein
MCPKKINFKKNWHFLETNENIVTEYSLLFLFFHFGEISLTQKKCGCRLFIKVKNCPVLMEILRKGTIKTIW